MVSKKSDSNKLLRNLGGEQKQIPGQNSVRKL